MQDSNLEQLAAALDGHEVTNEEGQVEETTPTQESAPEEQNTEPDTAPLEKAPEAEETAPNAETDDSENELAEDESGKRYVPKTRFDKIYGKAKAAERRAQELEALIAQGIAPQANEPSQSKAKPKSEETSGPSKADLLELKLALPQFDPREDEYGNATNPDYNPTLDALGYKIWKSNPSMSLVQAGREALRMAKDISKAQVEAQVEARRVKAVSSDQGITSRVLNRPGNKDVPGENASVEELEAYLRKTGEWDARS